MSRRFYKTVSIDRDKDGFAVLLDGRRVNTPDRKPLRLSTKALADAVADEWREQGEIIDPAGMKLTGLANAAIDRITTDRGAFERDLAGYGDTDLLYYRASAPEPLVLRQAEIWNPPLDWARRRFGIDFELVSGVMHRDQAPDVLKTLAAALASRDNLTLAVFARAVPLTGSLILMLAVDEGAMAARQGWEASILDELWQQELWGEDSQALDTRAARKADYDAAWRFRELCRSQS